MVVRGWVSTPLGCSVQPRYGSPCSEVACDGRGVVRALGQWCSSLCPERRDR